MVWLTPMQLPRAHVQGVKQSVVSVCLSVSTKISRSGDLGVIVKCKYHYSVGKQENFPSLTFQTLEKGHKCYKLRVSIHYAFRPHPLMPHAASTTHARTRCRKGSLSSQTYACICAGLWGYEFNCSAPAIHSSQCMRAGYVLQRALVRVCYVNWQAVH